MQILQFLISLEGINMNLVTESIIIKIDNRNIGQYYDCCGGFYVGFHEWITKFNTLLQAKISKLVFYFFIEYSSLFQQYYICTYKCAQIFLLLL